MSHVTYAEEIHALETILARVRQEKAALEREARYHQQELDTLLGKLRAYEQSHKNLSADCDALARERDALAAYGEQLRDALMEVAPGVPPVNASCHAGIVPQAKCRHCQTAIKAREALAETPATSLARRKAHVEKDAERLDWLEQQARKSRTGISFDWIPAYEGEPSGFRFMRRHFIGEQTTTLRKAIDLARGDTDA